MIDAIKNFDEKLFFIINGHHNETMDTFMFMVSGKEIWFPLYALLIGLTIWQLRKYSIIFILSAIAAVGASDYFTSGIMKPAFERYRPSRDPDVEARVHIVNDYRGGKYGFASSHASNTFAVATFFFLLWRKKSRWILLLLIWAFIVSISRVYLGVHYPGDILIGGLIGAAFGYLFYKVSILIMEKKFPGVFQTG